MAIGRSKGPRLIASGEVLNVAPRTKKDSAEVYAHDVTLDSGDGASVFVRVWERDAEKIRGGAVGTVWTVWCEVAVSTFNGRTDTSLNFEAEVTADDLDKMNSALSVKA